MFWKKKKLRFNWQKQIALSTPLDKLSFLVFDTEATGLNIYSSDRLIEIGAVLVQGLEVSKNTFQTYVQPNVVIPDQITKLTGINQEKLKNSPEATVAIHSFLSFMEDNQCIAWVGHGLLFDTTLIKRELQRSKHMFNPPPSIDTLDLLRYLKPQRGDKDLAEYASEYHTPIFPRHSALGDALTTAHLFCTLLKKYIDRRNNTWGDLLYTVENQQRNLVIH